MRRCAKHEDAEYGVAWGCPDCGDGRPPISQWVGALRATLDLMTPTERAEALSDLKSVYCFSCGDEQPKEGRRCQCWNDE